VISSRRRGGLSESLARFLVTVRPAQTRSDLDSGLHPRPGRHDTIGNILLTIWGPVVVAIVYAMRNG